MDYAMAHPLFVAEIRWSAVWVPVACTVEGSKKTVHSRPCPRTIVGGYTNIFHIAGCRSSY